MPFLDEQVNGLNAAWEAAISCLGSYRLMGIAETQQETRETGDKLVTVKYPGLVDESGEVTMIDVNNDYSITIYHRLDGIINGVNPRQAFGESYGRETETANMALLCFAFRNQIRRSAYWLENLIKDAMPATGRLATMHLSHYYPGPTSFDKIGLLAREYGGELNYPELVVFEMKYRMESNYQKGCFLHNNGC